MESKSLGARDRVKGKARKRAGQFKWQRPRARLSSRALSRMLTIVKRWKREREEPVVGRIKEEHGDPFAILVGTVLSLRTRDTVTEKAFKRLWAEASTPQTLLDLPLSDLEKAIHPVGFYRTKARSLKAIGRALLERHGGKVPPDLESLLRLPGVGRKTANLVVTEAFGRRGICVDTHVHRILNWWGFVDTHSPDETEQALRRTLPEKWWRPINGLLVSFGQSICKPVGPRCGECPVFKLCPYPRKKRREL